MRTRASQLQCFLTVAEEGQLTRAARKLELDQPALSHTIAQLESELGVVLFERQSHGMIPTPAGEAFLVKARSALAAETDAGHTAQALARAARGAIAIGFVGPPPAASTPELFSAFTETHPGAQISSRDLPFPRGTTSSWLAEVDVALCHRPHMEDGVSAIPVRVEPRAVVVHRIHPVARLSEISLQDVLDEAFIGYHPDVQPEWAAFHSLDDVRGEPPGRLTSDDAASSLQMAGIMSSSSRAITAVPHLDARLASLLLTYLVAIPLPDAAPAEVCLVWRSENRNPLLEDLLAAARARAPSLDGV